MPYIELKTNKKLTEAQCQSIASGFGEKISIIPGKSERWLMTSLEGDCRMTFAGSDAPCAIASVSIFGSADSETYNKLTSALCEMLSNELGIDAERIYVKYSEISEWGWNSQNF